jgi:predicted Rossmann fold nucleotide-binding protein DprA/Smf involved in DNA uptake
LKETGKLLKAIADGLKIMAKGVDSVANQVNKLAKSEAKTAAKPKPAYPKAAKATAAKKPVKKTAAKAKKTDSATDVVLNFIQKADNPVDNSKISKETGFDTKKVSNIMYRLKKQGKVKNVDRGTYAAA